MNNNNTVKVNKQLKQNKESPTFKKKKNNLSTKTNRYYNRI